MAVPVDVFAALAPLVSIEGGTAHKTTMGIRASLKSLLNYNLLKGSVAEGSGVFMHGA